MTVTAFSFRVVVVTPLNTRLRCGQGVMVDRMFVEFDAPSSITPHILAATSRWTFFFDWTRLGALNWKWNQSSIRIRIAISVLMNMTASRF